MKLKNVSREILSIQIVIPHTDYYYTWPLNISFIIAVFLRLNLLYRIVHNITISIYKYKLVIYDPLPRPVLQVATIAGVIVSLVAAGLLTLLALHCRNKRHEGQRTACSQGHLVVARDSKPNGADKQNMYSTQPKMNNLDRGLVCGLQSNIYIYILMLSLIFM